MTQLPATLLEPEALAYAKKLVAWYRDLPWVLPHSVLSAEAAHALARQHLKKRALQHPNHMAQIIEKARAGNRDAIEAMKELANEHIARNERMLAPLAHFQMQLNMGLIRSRRARDKTSNSLRNIAIASMVSELSAKFGLDPTGRSPRRFSACSVIAIALKSELQPGIFKPGEEAIETIWNDWKWAAGHIVITQVNF
jgi:hypothetical protein